MSARPVERPDDWRDEAMCAGFSELMMPPLEYRPKELRERDEERAKAICWRCPVRLPCLDYAIETRQPLGIWGGFNPAERRLLT